MSESDDHPVDSAGDKTIRIRGCGTRPPWTDRSGEEGRAREARRLSRLQGITFEEAVKEVEERYRQFQEDYREEGD